MQKATTQVAIFPRHEMPEAHKVRETTTVVVRIGSHGLYFDDKRHASAFLAAALREVAAIEEDA